MKIKIGVLLIALFSTMAWAQGPGMAPGGPGSKGGPGGPMGMHGPRPEFGTWWKNSELAGKLKLTDDQVKKLDESYYSHKLKLIDDSAEMQKADLKLRTLLDVDSPDQNQVLAAVDQVLAARGKVERETTMMMLDFRKILTVDQWKQLRASHPMGPGFHGRDGKDGRDGRQHGQMHGQRGGPGGPGGPPPDGGQTAPPPPQQD